MRSPVAIRVVEVFSLPDSEVIAGKVDGELPFIVNRVKAVIRGTNIHIEICSEMIPKVIVLDQESTRSFRIKSDSVPGSRLVGAILDIL